MSYTAVPMGTAIVERFAATAVHVLALAVHAAAGLAVRVVAKGEQRRDIVVGDQPDVAAVAAVAAVRAAVHHGAFTTEAHAASAAVACLHVQLALVDELGHFDQANGARQIRSRTIQAMDAATDDLRSGAITTDRSERWASTMAGHAADDAVGDIVVAHADSHAVVGATTILTREEREAHDDATLAEFATRSHGAGNRVRPEQPDPYRTCFERDRDRILHDSSFRRLAGKTQVFVFPEDHQRTRMTHALEVAQVGRSVARALNLNVPLVEAMAIGHDCGHGPGGHASEDALSPYLPTGFDHAPWGADVTLQPLNLCAETLDGIRNHSWSLPAPQTPEGEVVSWADRIAYVCHDFEDAVAAGIVTANMLPEVVAERCGRDRSSQLGTFVRAMITATMATGRVGMVPDTAEALAAFRAFNYEHVYLRPASRRQADGRRVAAAQALVEHYADRPHAMPPQTTQAVLGAGVDIEQIDAGSPEALRAAVGYVAGMTDRFACQQGLTHLDWDRRSCRWASGSEAAGLRLTAAATGRVDRALQIQLADAETHQEQAAEAVQQMHLVLDERARPIAVEDADHDDRREAVQGVELIEFHVVVADENDARDRDHERRHLRDPDRPPQQPPAQRHHVLRRGRPDPDDRIRDDEEPSDGHVQVVEGAHLRQSRQPSPPNSTETMESSASPVRNPRKLLLTTNDGGANSSGGLSTAVGYAESRSINRVPIPTPRSDSSPAGAAPSWPSSPYE